MSKENKAGLAVPILMIVVGVGWLVNNQGLGPGVNWVWTLGLAAVGLLVFALGGFDKATIVIGPFFLLASLLSVLRQTGSLSIDIEVPVLVISIGVLLLVARLPFIPTPGWLVPIPAAPHAAESDKPKRLSLAHPLSTPPVAGREPGGNG